MCAVSCVYVCGCVHACVVDALCLGVNEVALVRWLWCRVWGHNSVCACMVSSVSEEVLSEWRLLLFCLGYHEDRHLLDIATPPPHLACWPLAIFHNIIDTPTYNGFAIWSKLNPTWMAGKINWRRFFLEALVTLYAKVTPHSPHSSLSSTGKDSAAIWTWPYSSPTRSQHKGTEEKKRTVKQAQLAW